jgi:hypothetical protein
MIPIVIDTSVARAAANRPNANHPGPACTAAMLTLAGQPELGVVTSPDLHEEWKRHATPFAMKWLAELRGRKRVQHERGTWARSADVLVAAAEITPGQQEAVRKDEVVWSLAMVTGQRVLSNDLRQRALLRQLSAEVPELSDLAWVSAADQDAVPWLKTGAPRVAPHRVRDLVVRAP